MPASDLDKLHRERTSRFFKRLEDSDGDESSLGSLFVSEHAARAVDEQKVFFCGYDRAKVLGSLPYSPFAFVAICSTCVARDELDEFRKLVNSKLVIPVLIDPYKDYDSSFVEFISHSDHISLYEYSMFRYIMLRYLTGGGDKEWICSHCAQQRIKGMRSIARRRKDADDYFAAISRIDLGIRPYVYPDWELLDVAESACKEKDKVSMVQLARLSAALHTIRSSQVFDAPVDLSGEMVSLIQELEFAGNLSLLSDEQSRKRLVSDGLGIRVPSSDNIDAYIELVRHFQPTLSGIVQEINLDAGPRDSLLDKIGEVNYEVSRIEGTRRLFALEAGLLFCGQNKELLTAGLVATVAGLTTGWLGCASMAAAAGGKKLASKKGWLKPNPHWDALKERVAEDIRPLAEKAIKLYLGSKGPAVNVLFLRKLTDGASA